jgi:hypothetical protein
MIFGGIAKKSDSGAKTKSESGIPSARRRHQARDWGWRAARPGGTMGVQFSRTRHMGRFQRLAEHDRPTISLEIDGMTVTALAGDTLQVAILTNTASVRTSEFDDGQRAGFCLMAACQDCWVWTVSGARLRSCSTEAMDGMRIITRGSAWQLEQF